MDCDFLSWSKSTNIYDKEILAIVEQHKNTAGSLIIISYCNTYFANKTPAFLLNHYSFSESYLVEELKKEDSIYKKSKFKVVYSDNDKVFDIDSLIKEVTTNGL
jgi:hypothetical protein